MRLLSHSHVEVSHRLVQSDTDRCERALSLDSRSDSLPRRGESLLLHHGRQGVKQAAVLRVGLVLHLETNLTSRHRPDSDEVPGPSKQPGSLWCCCCLTLAVSNGMVQNSPHDAALADSTERREHREEGSE